MTWQPIETAPKDGAPILVYGVNPYSSPPHMGVREFYRGNWREPNISAYEFDDQLDGHAGTSFLTHWKPLDPPPEAP